MARSAQSVAKAASEELPCGGAGGDPRGTGDRSRDHRRPVALVAAAIGRGRTLSLAAPLVLALALPAPAAGLEQKLTAPDGAALGRSVAIEGDTAVVGAPAVNGSTGAVYVFIRMRCDRRRRPRDDAGMNPDQGSAYGFARTGPAARNQTARPTASDGAADDGLGSSVAVDGATVLAGAPGDDVGANRDQGSASIFFAPAARPAVPARPRPPRRPSPAARR